MITRPVPLNLGPLPATQINQILGLDLQAADVHFSARAQQHAHQRHPEDFEFCLRHIAQIVLKPDFIGRGPHQPDGFELIGAVQNETAMILVAIKIRRDAAGRYLVASTYRIDGGTLRRRLRMGFIARAKN